MKPYLANFKSADSLDKNDANNGQDFQQNLFNFESSYSKCKAKNMWLKCWNSGALMFRIGFDRSLVSLSGVSGAMFSIPSTNDNCLPDSWCLLDERRFCQSPSQPWNII